MDFFRSWLKRIKLGVLYFTRIIFAENNFKVGIFTKIKCNILGGFLADQYVLYDLKENDKKDFLSEFDWYKSRYINEPFDFAFNNKVVCTEILRQYIKVAENLFIKNKGLLYDFSSGLKKNEDILNCLIKKKRLIIKPFSLGKGRGVHLLGYDAGKFYIDDVITETYDFLEFLDKRDNFIICEFIKQHKYLCQSVKIKMYIYIKNNDLKSQRDLCL